jgi:DNA-directed RNA polymerase subunit omega
MIHPSYTDLMNVVNEGVEPGEEPVVNSRYSIVMAAAKRARQIIGGDEPMATADCNKPFSIAVEELYEGKVKIIGDGEETLEEMEEDADIDVIEEDTENEAVELAEEPAEETAEETEEAVIE